MEILLRLRRFNFGDNFIIPRVDVATTSVTSTVDLQGNPFPELEPDANVLLDRFEVNGRNTVLFGGNTLSRQILLIAYDEATGELIDSQFLGFSNPFEINSFSRTSDGGMAVLATTFVAGRFPRIVIFKLSPQELIDLAN